MEFVSGFYYLGSYSTRASKLSFFFYCDTIVREADGQLGHRGTTFVQHPEGEHFCEQIVNSCSWTFSLKPEFEKMVLMFKDEAMDDAVPIPTNIHYNSPDLQTLAKMTRMESIAATLDRIQKEKGMILP